MAEYIDKNKVVLNYGGLAKIAPNDNAGIAKYFADQIKAIPAADVAPVRLHGGLHKLIIPAHMLNDLNVVVVAGGMFQITTTALTVGRRWICLNRRMRN